MWNARPLALPTTMGQTWRIRSWNIIEAGFKVSRFQSKETFFVTLKL
jgi:hypothetical protein